MRSLHTGVTVVIPAYNAQSTLPAVLDALPAALGDVAAEVIVVDSTGRDAVDRLSAWPVTVLAPETRWWPSQARNEAIKVSSTEWIAFLDADAIPDPGWLPALLAKTSPGVAAVAGAVRNGTPGSRVGTAGWLLEFSEFRTDRQSAPRHGATCNLLVRRSVLAERDGFPLHLWPGEDTVVTFGLAEIGRLHFAADATVAHVNRTEIGEFLRHQRRLGVSFGLVCQEVDYPHRWMARKPFSLGAGVLRLPALLSRVRRNPADLCTSLRLIPLLLLGLSAWTIGLVKGQEVALIGVRTPVD